jgi:hypothetical protein
MCFYCKNQAKIETMATSPYDKCWFMSARPTGRLEKAYTLPLATHHSLPYLAATSKLTACPLTGKLLRPVPFLLLYS